MRVHDAWKRLALDPQGQPVKHVWDEYLALEKAVYERILKDKTTAIEGTVAELAERFKMSAAQVSAFLEGIHECVEGVPELSGLEETTPVKFEIEYEKLYKQMVEYKAEALYTLPEWDEIFSKEQQKQYYTEQKKSHTIIRNENKIGRNEPCPCGSGQKYKRCCGAA
jgi:transcriptional regulator with XRE-family HTH domain